MPLTVMLVGSHEMVLAGMAISLGREPDVEIVGQASDLRSAARLAASVSPRAAVLHLTELGLDGPGLCARLRSLCPELRLVALADCPDGRLIGRRLRLGACELPR